MGWESGNKISNNEQIETSAEVLSLSLKYNGEMEFNESFNMQSMSNKLDENDYEENIQTNLSNTITRKLILRLSQLKWF